VARYAGEQSEDSDSAAIADAVLDALVRPREVRYGEYSEGGGHIEHEWPFALVREVDEGRGVHLRARSCQPSRTRADPAINLLVGALEVRFTS
jgi:hypothetical protein